MILHIPHSSTFIPPGVVFDKDIALDLHKMTDWKTDKLFAYPAMSSIVFPYSRLFCDVERLHHNEPMEHYGHGICYTRDSSGNHLRNVNISERMHILENYYWPHHRSLLKACNHALSLFDKVVIVDCHSFSDEALFHEEDKTTPRPDFCLGTDEFHTPVSLVEELEKFLIDNNYTVRVNSPFAGTIVPIDLYKKTPELKSVMIEVNRALYINSEKEFEKTKQTVNKILEMITRYEQSHD